MRIMKEEKGQSSAIERISFAGWEFDAFYDPSLAILINKEAVEGLYSSCLRMTALQLHLSNHVKCNLPSWRDGGSLLEIISFP